VAQLATITNTFVIADVRWLADSNTIPFLGKQDGPNQQLFVANVCSSKARSVTSPDVYVTAYDIRADTIAYTTLMNADGEVSPESAGTVVTITGKDVYSLVFPMSNQLDDISV
jgi:hypothetical protein